MEIKESVEGREEPKVPPKRRMFGCIGCVASPILLLIGLTVFGYINGDLNSIRAHDLVIENDFFKSASTYEDLMSLPFFSEREVTRYLEVDSYKYAELDYAMYSVLFKEDPRLLVLFYRNGFTQINEHVRLRDTIFRDGIQSDIPHSLKERLSETARVLKDSGVDYDFQLYLERLSK